MTAGGKVTVFIENTYVCGRESSGRVAVEPPRDESDLARWWEDVVFPHTGDGHPCGSREHALYEARVVEAPHRPELVGATYSWEG